MSILNDISCGTKDNEQECLAHARVVSLYARKFGTGQWTFSGPRVLRKNGLPSKRTVHVKSTPPNAENSMQYGYDENDNNNMSNETKRETNYSTTKWNDVNTHNYMQLTKYNKYTNDDICTNACVVHMIH